MANPPEQVSLPQISYALAYYVLPGYAHTRLSKIQELLRENPEAAGPFFYIMACQIRKTEPNRPHAERYSWKTGQLDDENDFFVMVYPKPPPVLITQASIEAFKGMTLAPHFSAIIRNRKSGSVQYYVLGQSPFGGGTTLRSVSVDPMVNSNLGPGPEPDLDAFLASIAFRLARKMQASSGAIASVHAPRPNPG